MQSSSKSTLSSFTARLVAVLLLVLQLQGAHGKLVRHELHLSEFWADPTGGGLQLFAGINGGIIGPTIEVQRGDRLQLFVVNNLNAEMSFHCHGLEFRRQQHMDGVIGLTQCAIPPLTNFTYDFDVLDYPGTYWYHPHATLETLSSIDVMKGPLIIRPADGSQDVHADLFDAEQILFFSDHWHHSQHTLYQQRIGEQLGPVMVDEDKIRVSPFPFSGLLLNGYPTTRTPALELGKDNVRLRIINGAWIFPFEFSVDGHILVVLQTDGADVVPFETDAIQMFPGERYDVLLVRRSHEQSSFWLRAETWGVLDEETPQFRAPVRYGTIQTPKDSRNPSPRTLNCGLNRGPKGTNCIPITAMRRHPNAKEIYGAANIDSKKVVRHVVDSRFTTSPSFGHFMKIDGDDRSGSEWTVKEFFSGNYTQFAFPHLPPLQHGDEHLSLASTRNTITAVHNTTVEILLRNIDRFPHPMHIHGHKFIVLEQGSVDIRSCSVDFCINGLPANREEYTGSTESLIFKDTIMMPAGGWVRIRFVADNPGWWIFHCHIHLHLIDGMAITLYEPGPEGFQFPPLPSDFPVCKNASEPKTCSCYDHKDNLLDMAPLPSYVCSRNWNCMHESSSLKGLPNTAQLDASDRVAGRAWRYTLAVLGASFVALLFVGPSAHRFIKKGLISRRVLGMRLFSSTSMRTLVETDVSSEEVSYEDAAMKSPEEPRQPSIFWKDLGVATPAGKQLIHGLCGSLQQGEIMGIIGMSGAGKTTFLDVVTNRGLRGGAAAHGTLLLGGNPASKIPSNAYNNTVRYCQQFESLPENMEVIDFLAFCANIRSTDMSRKDARRRSKEVIAQFGLSKVAYQRISTLSGGQKKRVAVAMEMIKPALVNVFDEPFSGLDASTTLEVFKYLRSVSKINDSSLIMTLHSVPPQLFERLDKVLILCSGKQVFFGSPAQALEYVDKSLNRPCVPGWTVSDHFVNIVTQMERASPGKCSEIYDSSAERAQACGSEPETRTTLAGPDTSAWQQFVQLTRREFLQELPNTLSAYQAAQFTAISLLVGWIFWGVGSSTLQRDLRERISLFFYTTTLYTFTPLYGAIARMRQRLVQVDGELKKGLYTVGPYVAAIAISDTLIGSIWPAFYSVIVFAMADCGPTPSEFILLAMLVALCSNTYYSLGSLLSVVISSITPAMALATSFAQTTLVAGGFYRTLPASIQWAGLVSLTTYAFSGLVKVELSWQDTTTCHPLLMGDVGRGAMSCSLEHSGVIDDLKRRGIDVVSSPIDTTPGIDFAVLMLFLVLSKVLIFVVLRYKLAFYHTKWGRKGALHSAGLTSANGSSNQPSEAPSDAAVRADSRSRGKEDETETDTDAENVRLTVASASNGSDLDT